MAELVKFNAMRRAIAAASNVDEVKDIRDKAEALRAYCKQAGEGIGPQNQCAEIKIRAERRAGEMLGETVKHKGRPKKVLDDRTLLPDGVSRFQSHTWQRIASIPADDFNHHLASEIDAKRELTTAGTLRFGKRLNVRSQPPPDKSDTRLENSLESFAGQEFGTIYADPPWRYSNQATRSATDTVYQTMPLDEICELPVESLAAENAHLHLWTTNAFIFDAKKVIDAWGFEYKSCFVWCKPQMGIGNYWRVSHEFLLLAVRGKCTFADHGLKSWIEANRTKHSKKPEAVAMMIEKASPGPYLEMFARQVRVGWSCWGNEVEHDLMSLEAVDGS